MLTFSDFMKVYEAYTTYAKSAQPVTQQVAQPVTQQVAQQVTQQVTPPVTQQVAQPTNADIMAALGALKTPFVNAQTPAQESIDDVICRIAGIQIPKEDQKGDK